MPRPLGAARRPRVREPARRASCATPPRVTIQGAPPATGAVFTPEGSFGQTKGREALIGMINGMRTSMGTRSAGMHHIMSNQNIEFLSPTRARMYYYWQTVFGGPAGAQTPPRVAAVGRGMDDVVKVNGKWLIESRNVSCKHPSEGNLPTNAPAAPRR